MKIIQNQKYICYKNLPYWVIYRDKFFDMIYHNMQFGLFSVFRDRQVTNSNTSCENSTQKIRVVKSRNIDNEGERIINIERI